MTVFVVDVTSALLTPDNKLIEITKLIQESIQQTAVLDLQLTECGHQDA